MSHPFIDLDRKAFIKGLKGSKKRLSGKLGELNRYNKGCWKINDEQ